MSSTAAAANTPTSAPSTPSTTSPTSPTSSSTTPDQSRSVDTRSVDTMCGYCGVGCGLTLTASPDGTLTSRGTPDHPVNRGRLCTKGSTTADLLVSGGRQTTALVDGEASDTTGAVNEVARRFTALREEHGHDAVALYVSGQMTLEAQYVANKLAKGYLRTNLIESNSRLCMASASTGYKQAFGADGPPGSYDDLDHADVFLVTGANMADCHPILFLRMMDRVKAGAKLIVVDPRRTATAKKADLHLPVAPGTDMALLNGLLRMICDNGDTDPEFIASYTDNWEVMEDHLADYPVEEVSRITGIEEDDLRTAAEWIGSTRRFVSLWTMGLNQSVHGTWHTTALCNLHLATGALCTTGAGPFSLTGQPNAMGGREMGYMGPGLPGQRSVLDDAQRAEVEDIWEVPPGTLHTDLGGGTVDLFRELGDEDSPVRAVWVICTNPAATVPNSSQVIKGLTGADLVVVQDAYAGSATAGHADIVLPAALWTESDGVMVNSERTMTLSSPLLDAPGEAAPDWELICRVARAMGFPGFDFASAAEIFDEIRRFHNPRTGWDLRGVDHARLKDGPVQWPVAPGGDARNPVRYLNDGISQSRLVTDDGEVPRLAFPTDTGRAQFVARPWLPPHELPDEDFPLTLTTGRLPHQWHTMTKTGRVKKLMKLNPSGFVQVHLTDAEPLGIGAGDIVRVTSRRGTLDAPAVVDEGIVPGTCFIPMHFANVPVNELTTDAVDPESLQPEFKACAVSLLRVAAAPKTPDDMDDDADGADGADDADTVSVVWASQTGTVEEYVPGLVSSLTAVGVPARARCADSVDVGKLQGTVLFVVSSTGDGDAPDMAASLWEELEALQNKQDKQDASGAAGAPALAGLRCAVLGFGDSSYADFCGFARKLEDRVSALGAELLLPRASCEPDFAGTAASWFAAAAEALGADPDDIARATSSSAASQGPARGSRANPVTATVAAASRLTGGDPGATGREVRRYTFTLPCLPADADSTTDADSASDATAYSTGDALGVLPRNRATTVDEFLHFTGLDPAVPHPETGQPLREALTRLDITSVTPALLELVHRQHPDAGIDELTGSAGNTADTTALRTFAYGRHLCDVLASYPVTADLTEWLEVLTELRPRLYSISSSPLADPNQVEITVSTVAFTSPRGASRRGVSSGFLAELAPGDEVEVFIKPNRSFGPPERPDAPMIMIGPGTGVAPFRGFLQDRMCSGAAGDNWLFFGDRHRDTDFLYGEELSGMHHRGILTRFDTAFSRDQEKKVYVQDRMLHHAADLWEWIGRGAHLYVCGDAGRMAADVDSALCRIVAEQGRMDSEDARSFVAGLAAERRYVRDVY